MDDKNITHVLFDLDGLLIDTERLYTEAVQQICTPHGKEFTMEIKMTLMGKKEREAGHMLIDQLSLPLTVDQYLEQIHKIQEDIFPSVHILPGVMKLLNHLKKHNIPMAIATGSDAHSYEMKTCRHDAMLSFFTHAVLSGSDPEVEHGKPSPDCFLVAAKRFENPPKPKNVLVFEDAVNGVDAALAAGMSVVWVPMPELKSLGNPNPTLTLESLEHFKPEVVGLPPYDE